MSFFLPACVQVSRKVSERTRCRVRASVVLERLGDELAVGAVVLDPLGDDVDRDVADDVFDAASARVCTGVFAIAAVGSGFRAAVAFLAGNLINGRSDRIIGAGFIDLHWLAVEVRVGEKLGGLLEVHDGEVELAVVLVDPGAAADDLLELGHRLDALVQHDELAGLGIHAGGHQLARWWR